MKIKITDKKKLQRDRNVLTAQLSRDRKKLELELMRIKCIRYISTLNQIRNSILSQNKKQMADYQLFGDDEFKKTHANKMNEPISLGKRKASEIN
jgi:hypothetical protein